ncbi:MAG: metallopeptidase family protein [Myxococcaceae bacterium]|nr:metallopeptidase family protein [Myxococcaceae bacterium]
MPSRFIEDASAEALFAEAEQALFDGQPEEALALVGRLEARAPSGPGVAGLRASAQAALGELDAAEETLVAARKRWPEDLDLLCAHAELLVTGSEEDRPRIEEGLGLVAKGLKWARKRGDTELVFELLLLEGIGRNQLGECTVALGSLEAALELQPRAVEPRLERALALFELCRFSAAEESLHALVVDAPEEPWAHHTLGLLAERRRDAKTARRWFRRAQELAPEDFPPPVQLTEEEFDRALADALEQLPAHVKDSLENTTIAVEEIPTEDDLLGSMPPLSPTILGLFKGHAVPHRELLEPSHHLTCSIVLYQRNLERFARTREELIEQIGITVMHEVGHLIGLDEEDLWERGLE